MTSVPDQGGERETLGSYLKAARGAVGLTLRGVQARTENRVTNGYLSQIENNSARNPSPHVLYDLAEVYGIDYTDLLVRAGHRIPRSEAPAAQATVSGVPLRALEDLTESEQKQLLQFLAFLKSQRPQRD
ncbi:helix-turn-helix domain-containing protein [Mycobacterium paraffinicum]|uniref:helix-turn-helix domain-containing protein n=1 Tax=Mycobacterium paraffinicum TaxID=53378 RepID=UPI000A0190BE